MESQRGTKEKGEEASSYGDSDPATMSRLKREEGRTVTRSHKSRAESAIVRNSRQQNSKGEKTEHIRCFYGERRRQSEDDGLHDARWREKGGR